MFAVTLIGGTLAAASANTLNCYLDRDIDAVMRRTAHRPLVAKAGRGTIKPGEALASGIVLGVAATLLLGLVVNWLAAFLAAGAILFYVFVYTLGLKRRTASNIVIGGAAGCFPVLVGWAAVTGTVAWPAAALFAIIFLWTPPHFWALAMRFRDDYAAASMPMLPVVATAADRRPQDPRLLLRDGGGHARPGPYAGWIYAVCAAGLGGWFLAEAHRLHGQVGSAPARPGRIRLRPGRPDAAVPPVHRLPDPAVLRDRGHRAAARGPLVAGSWPSSAGPAKVRFIPNGGCL